MIEFSYGLDFSISSEVLKLFWIWSCLKETLNLRFSGARKSVEKVFFFEYMGLWVAEWVGSEEEEEEGRIECRKFGGREKSGRPIMAWLGRKHHLVNG